MVSTSLYLWIAIMDTSMFIVNMWLIVYVAFGKEWLRNKLGKNKIKHGTYLEVSMWDLGVKTGNFPALNVDEFMSNLGTRIGDVMKPNVQNELIKLLAKDKTQGEIKKILEFINNSKK